MSSQVAHSGCPNFTNTSQYHFSVPTNTILGLLGDYHALIHHLSLSAAFKLGIGENATGKVFIDSNKTALIPLSGD